ncbi:DUF4230 domain-containing protein [Campylobacter corcagiensis]|uniref:DUF4230 domain-containing protein n=1 Tax=Campylobacter corcagiensis TaxID=1448857 RepID=A0A7M1LGQ3_9BACT|nr:DUF4230 domain-containing protein [Campylobacter corcagiensis]QKF64802.1 DUF4230 domain-containing protein [Campylobacter corcagiensis]QOQ87036.1 DUF4230 domain-containing protein [Campylobacter corcagiensis]
MEFLVTILILVLVVVSFLLYRQNLALKKAKEKPKINTRTEITKLKSIGELSVFKIYSKEIVTRKDSPIESKLWNTLLGWSMTKKQIAVIFEFEIDFIYDLKSRDFSIKELGEGNFKITMPACKYKFSIRDMKIYDEKNSKFMPFLLPDSINGLFGPSFDESEKNQLIDSAKDEIKSMSVKIINDMGDQIHKSASDTLTAIAKNFGANSVEFEFVDKNIEKVDVKDSKVLVDKRVLNSVKNSF